MRHVARGNHEIRTVVFAHDESARRIEAHSQSARSRAVRELDPHPGADAVACLDRTAHTAMFCAANVTGSPTLRAWQKEIVLRELAAA